jgi:HKD family nuclease
MASQPTLYAPLMQVTGGAFHLADRLNQLLGAADLKRLRIAVSYVKWSGLGLLSSQMELFLKNGGELQTIYGVSNGVTTPESLLYSLYLQDMHRNYNYAGVIEDQYANATFHPKFFEFKFKNKTVALVGSGNLTTGGLVNNTELGSQVEFDNNDRTLITVLDDAWNAFSSLARPITLQITRKLHKDMKLGSEKDTHVNVPPAKPYLKSKKYPAKKPLYLKILDIENANTRHSFLSRLDTLSVKPKKLYLQVLEYETGAQKSGSGAGYQVQLPVATLATFFGVGPDETQQVTLYFGPEEIQVSLTHFENKTHRVRLRPIKDIPRPAIVIFERVSKNSYNCSIVPPRRYHATLVANCTEQTRAGARRWGLV